MTMTSYRSPWPWSTKHLDPDILHNTVTLIYRAPCPWSTEHHDTLIYKAPLPWPPTEHRNPGLQCTVTLIYRSWSTEQCDPDLQITERPVGVGTVCSSRYGGCCSNLVATPSAAASQQRPLNQHTQCLPPWQRRSRRTWLLPSQYSIRFSTFTRFHIRSE